jgi:hypothetical protein
VKRRLLIAGMVISLLSLLVAASLGFRAGLIADEAEHNLLAARSITRSLEGYVWNEGMWPDDFDALAPYRVETNIYRWPDDRDQILKRVDLDFDLTIEEIASSRAPHRFLRYQTPMFEGALADDLERVVYVAQKRLEKNQTKSSQ